MQTIDIAAGKPYKVHIGSGILGDAGALLRNIWSGENLALVADENVSAIYGERVCDIFEQAGFRVFLHTFPAGEKYKNITELTRLLEALASREFGRGDMVAALGGGVTGDLAGFAASVYQRGIEYIQLPTTLLAAVDSSVGGKTAVNLEAGKNLAGTFWQPSMVICDCDTFATLPRKELASGAAECLKYGMLGSSSLIALLTQTGLDAPWSEIIDLCVHHKARIVEEDERENGVRTLLNFGHTFGHAAELLSGYKIRHGEGVAMGMMLITRAAEQMGICEGGTSTILENALKALELPTNCPYSAAEFARAALGDKKRRSNSITLVLPKSAGECFLKSVDINTLPEFLSAGLGRD